MNVWIVSEGKYFFDEVPFIKCVFGTKKEATAFCRKDGYKWNSEEELFLKDSIEKYRKVEGFVVGSPNSYLDYKP